MKTNLDNPDLLKTSSLIDGIEIDSKSRFSVNAPGYNKEIVKVGEAENKVIHEAIDSAERGFNQWRKVDYLKKAELIDGWLNLVKENREDLARLVSLENGKAIKDARGEISYGISFMEWYKEEAKRIRGEILPGSEIIGSNLSYSYEPAGVVAAITPWNFPMAMITRKVVPAIAAGCSVVLKPSEITPLSALALANLAHKAGLTKGVFNVVIGDASEIGKTLCKDKRIKKLTFTGSTRVGKILYKQCAENVLKLSLELGGNAPFMVLDDANLEHAAESLLASKLRSSGQACTSANRVFVHNSVYNSFVEKIKQKFSSISVGASLEEKSDLAAVISDDRIKNYRDLLDDATNKGAKIELGGDKSDLEGSYFQPTIVTDVTSEMDLFSEEIFGPIASIIKFDTEEELIELANKTNYGLASYLFTESVRSSERITKSLEFGMVGINQVRLSTSVAPFSGVKESGIGIEGSHLGIYEFMNTKYINHKIL